jgi:hypothetical protein
VRSMIAFCGIDCGECKALIATQKNDPEMRKTIAAEWSKEFGHQVKPEDINCVGCVITDGPHISYCSVCEIRACGSKKNVENCAFCIEYGCEKLAKFHERAPKAKARLEETRKKTETK